MTTSSKANIGSVVPVVASQTPQATTPVPSAPTGPKLIWLRSDKPFVGTGTRVMLEAEPGVTKRGYLTVPFRFQYPPLDSVVQTIAHDWESFTTIGADPHERIRPTARRLRTLPLRTLFTDWNASYTTWPAQTLEPVLAWRELANICDDAVVFRLKIRTPRFAHDDVNMLAVLTAVEVTEQSGEPDARYVALTIQQYRASQIEREQTLGSGPWTHTLRPGDTLYGLSRLYYRQQTLWAFIVAITPSLAGWAPSRPLDQWAQKHHRTRLLIPQRPPPGMTIASVDSVTAGTGGVKVG